MLSFRQSSFQPCFLQSCVPLGGLSSEQLGAPLGKREWLFVVAEEGALPLQSGPSGLHLRCILIRICLWPSTATLEGSKKIKLTAVSPPLPCRRSWPAS